MATDDAGLADRLDRILDGLVETTDRWPNGPPAAEPELAATVHRLRARDDAPTADRDFADRLLEELMHATTYPGPVPFHPNPAPTPALDGRASPRPTSRPVLRLDTSRPRWLLAQVATAALLVLTIAGSLVVFGPLRPGAGDRAAWLPAVGTPVPGPPVAFVWQTKGGPDFPLRDPINPAIDPQGNLWVVDGRNSRFQVFAADGTFLEVWGTPGSGEGQFAFVLPVTGWSGGAAAFDAQGNLYVADVGNHRVQKFGPDRRFLLAWGSEGAGDGQFLYPVDLAVGAGGNVYVVDVARNDIQVFAGDGRFLFKFADEGSGQGQLRFPGGLAVDGAGDVWVADSGNDRVERFAADGTFLAAWGGVGRGDGQFGGPSDVAVDGRGRVYVADFENDRVQVFAGDGQFLASWGKSGTDAGEFFSPIGIALDGAGHVYVSDYAEPRVQKFRLLPPLTP